MIMGERANIFDDDDGMNLTDFEAKDPKTILAVEAEHVRAVAEGASFRSREPRASKSEDPWRYRTGRDVQFNAKVTATTKAAYQDIARETNRPLGEVLERALAALQRERANQDGQM